MTVVSVLGNFEAAVTVFQNVMHTKSKSLETAKFNPDQARNLINTYIAEIRKQEDLIQKASVKNDNHYIDEAMAGLSRSYQSLQTYKNLQDIYISGNKMYIQLKDIHAYVPEFDVTLDYGNYMVLLDLITGGINIYSTKRFIVEKPHKKHTLEEVESKLKKFQYPCLADYGYSYLHSHPHVRGVGPCLGNLGGMMAQLLAKHQYDTAVEMIVAYLQAVNLNDGWGKVAMSFPIIKGEIKDWSEKNYPRLTEYDYKMYLGFRNTFEVVEFNEDSLIRSVLQLPDTRRTIEQLVNESAVVEEVVEETIELSPNATPTNTYIDYDTQGNLVQMVMETPATSAASEPTPAPKKRTRKKAPAVTENVEVTEAPKPKRSRKAA